MNFLEFLRTTFLQNPSRQRLLSLRMILDCKNDTVNIRKTDIPIALSLGMKLLTLTLVLMVSWSGHYSFLLTN